ncbi:hypothetical protein K461DRAFT_309749 [Myriangium duriaei CBS 260.36]|uniref:Arrestin-like N-terminal domain-containing protein n=1 Tax=Myriangium duriaei CBS 260.36 TaxID=1168546 RepID=A0A9P4J9A1_9PEZI|nr:hypothetical protein K461DRAFT_309749 [Myriangium duriaei CBS 260.36]
MPEVHTSSSPALQSLPQKKSIFSRLSSPFASTSRTVAEFTVQADDPHRRYSPGDLVRGSVVLKLVKATRITHIVVCLHGFVQVYKTAGVPPADGFRAHNNIVGKGKGHKKGAYFGNGFATLFEEEAVLCGDGRLEEGNYKFEFQIRFPEQTLPSSIDFERGTISYMVTATLTRPHSISPVLFDDQKLFFNERIDIAQLLPPKPRTINLEPLLKRSHTKSSSRRRTGQSDSIRREDGATTLVQGTPRSLARLTSDLPPRSPSPSLHSLESRHSSGPTPSEPGSVARSSRASDTFSSVNFAPSTPKTGRKITVMVESMRGGTLRGDIVPLHLVISHTKHIKSMQGVIVTLFRQARVDTHPELPLGPTTDGEKRKFEDYYPKSLTGLGGLSLSGAGSSHLFRKDLTQAVVPLIVDPSTLTAELHPKVRVPDESFPTIACVPGAMISFKYFIEVVVDIQGKLGNSEKYFSQPNHSQFAEYSTNNSIDADGGRSERYLPNSYMTPFIDTTAIRRDKSVVTCVLEVVVGTEDSERRKGKERAVVEPEVHAPSEPPYEGSPAFDDSGNYYDNYGSDPYDTQYNGDSYWDEHYQEPPAFFPPDTLPDTELSEKERIRRAEDVLLPSQPPEDSEYPDAGFHSASAPQLEPGSHADYAAHRYACHNQRSQPVSAAYSLPAEPTGTAVPRYSQIGPSPSRRAGPSPTAADNKDDLQRRELEEQASEPPVDAATTGNQTHGPIVPHDYDIDDLEHIPLPDRSGHDPNAMDHLPLYER